MTNKSTKLAATLAAALALGALGATSADAAVRHAGYAQPAAPMQGYTMVVNYHDSGNKFGFNDRNHRPAPRMEIRMRMPHRGYHWHAGNWNWQRGHWVWVSGFWNFR